MTQFDSYFSNGLKPPTSKMWKNNWKSWIAPPSNNIAAKNPSSEPPKKKGRGIQRIYIIYTKPIHMISMPFLRHDHKQNVNKHHAIYIDTLSHWILEKVYNNQLQSKYRGCPTTLADCFICRLQQLKEWVHFHGWLTEVLIGTVQGFEIGLTNKALEHLGEDFAGLLEMNGFFPQRKLWWHARWILCLWFSQMF